MTVIDIETAAAPRVRSDRWAPTRAGLVGLWHYWDETFTFHRGRLLLRGPNGSGKSMALELLLPFVLDADISPYRLTSAAKSRGGLYDRILSGTDDPTRAGFAWVEFGRGAEVFTAGVRLRASATTRKVDADFFTTSQAVGRQLHLLDVRREPLSRKGLAAALGTDGQVHNTRDEHRAAVRTALFPGFSADRYDSVITALLALRKEKLSHNLDLDKLSEVLTEALPAIDDHDLAAVAEGFERLDRRKAELAALEAELAEVRVLAGRQRAYARAVLAQVAGRVRSAESRRDAVTRAEREATVELEEAEAQAARTAARLVAADVLIGELDDQIEGLRSSAAYQEGGQLGDLKEQLRALERAVVRAEGELRSAEGAVGAATLDHQRAAAALATAAANHDTAASDVRRAAGVVGAEGVLGEAGDLDEVDDALRLVSAWLQSRRQRVAEVRAALAVHEDAVRRRSFGEERVADDQDAADERASAHRLAAHDLEAARTAFAAAVEAWAGEAEAVGPARLRTVLEGLDPHPTSIRAAVGALTTELGAEHALARRSLEVRRDDADAARGALVAERESVAQGGLVDPPSPAWRADRAGRAGAPLWRLVDVVTGDAPDRIEAALLAAGLLDAWVDPDGTVEIAESGADITLTARPVTGPTLAGHLVALPDTAVPVEVVEAVLRSVPVEPSAAAPAGGLGTGEPEVVIGVDGTFRLGAAAGRGPAGPATLLGATARERHRLIRLAELDRAIEAADAALAEVERHTADLERRVAAIAADLGALPSGDEVVDAERELDAAGTRLAEAQGRLAASRTALQAAEHDVRAALRTLTSVGSRHQLPTSDADLVAVERALDAFEQAAAVWGRRRQDHAARADRATASSAVLEREQAAAGRAADRLGETRSELASLATRVATLESAIGTEYAEVLAQIGKLSGALKAAKTEASQLRDARSGADMRIGKLGALVEEAAAQRATAEHERSMAHRRFVVAVEAGLAADASVDVPGALDGVTAVLDSARGVVGVVGEPDDAGADRTSSRVDEALHQARSTLGGRVDFHRELADDGWWVLRVSTVGLRRRVNELADSLAAELEVGRQELAAEEEQLFEQVLAGSIRRALADRIRLANQLVDRINQQLGKVRTQAGGVEVRLRWEVDPEQLEAVKAARALLLREPSTLSEPEAAALQAFVRARVEQARAELEANAPWEARLRETLDYRAWHRFSLHVGHRDWDGHRPATPRLLQRLSTGERSIVLHLPMLASIAAHYADPDGEASGCPRLILLDELFAGVDTANRAQLFGTFTAWDLDAVFTSDHEWCQYATLDGIAIHQLHPPTGDEPVTSTRFWWDGHHRSIDPATG